jgi:hypothetical protein
MAYNYYSDYQRVLKEKNALQKQLDAYISNSPKSILPTDQTEEINRLEEELYFLNKQYNELKEGILTIVIGAINEAFAK